MCVGGYDVRAGGIRATAVGARDAAVLRDACRVARIRSGQRVHRRHYGAGAVPRAHETLPLSEGKLLSNIINHFD